MEALLAANHLVHLSVWWNPHTEAQADDRLAGRLQTRPLHIHRIVIRDTVEENVRAIADKKRQLNALLPHAADEEKKHCMALMDIICGRRR